MLQRRLQSKPYILHVGNVALPYRGFFVTGLREEFVQTDHLALGRPQHDLHRLLYDKTQLSAHIF